MGYFIIITKCGLWNPATLKLASERFASPTTLEESVVDLLLDRAKEIDAALAGCMKRSHVVVCVRLEASDRRDATRDL